MLQTNILKFCLNIRFIFGISMTFYKIAVIHWKDELIKGNINTGIYQITFAVTVVHIAALGRNYPLDF